MKTTTNHTPQRDRDGALFEPMPGDRETGDGDGDKKYHIEAGVLTPQEIEELFNDTEETNR